MKTIFARNLERIQKERGLSNSDIARMAGVDKSQVGNWLKDNGPQPNSKYVRSLAMALGVTTDYLLMDHRALQEPPEINELRVLLSKMRPRDRRALVATASLWINGAKEGVDHCRPAGADESARLVPAMA